MPCDPDTGLLTLAFPSNPHAGRVTPRPSDLATVSDGRNTFASWLVPWKVTFLSVVKHKNTGVC